MKPAKLLKYSASLLVVSVMMVLTACGNKSSSDPVVQPVYQPCVNCQQNIPGQGQLGSVIFQAESQDYYGMVKFNWSFTAQGTIGNNYNGYNNQGNIYGGGSSYGNNYGNTMGSPVVTYSGPVSANGTISVAQVMSSGNCQLPAGAYNLITSTPGQWTSAMVYNLRMQANGPAAVVLTLAQGQVSAKTGSQLGQTWSEINPVGRIFGNVMIESINGVPCNTQMMVQ
ncbi:MAG: hypothetical protein WA160_15810 [Pseudobdellovibrio sp.]